MNKKIKESKAIIMVDLIAAIIIFTMFTGIIIILMTKTYQQNLEIRIRSTAMTYATIILEKIDEKSYAQIMENKNCLLDGIDLINSDISINVGIENVPNINSNANDLMKVINVTVKYNYSGGTQTLNFSKLKIKENI